MAKKFKFNVKIYYEDTDSGGVVYYANYLKFLERARSETLYSLDFTNSGLLENHGILLIVKSCNIEYKKPAKFEDKLEIISEVLKFTKTSLDFKFWERLASNQMSCVKLRLPAPVVIKVSLLKTGILKSITLE